MKYGALSNADGRIDIRWTVGQGDGEFALTWTESGGPVVSDPQHAGFGSIVDTRLAGQAVGAEATLELARSGILWSLKAPARLVMDR